jgi:WD40 repeat protein
MRINSAAFSMDGKRAVTASDDGTARIWDLSGARPSAVVLEGHDGPLLSAAFNSDGKRVVTASDDGTARVWRVFPDISELTTLIRARLSRCLSQRQREKFGLLVSDRSTPRDFIPAPNGIGGCPR